MYILEIIEYVKIFDTYPCITYSCVNYIITSIEYNNVRYFL